MTARHNPYKHFRRGKRSKDEHNVKSMGARTYGYDYGHDGWRNIVEYKKCRNYLRSKVGQPWNKIWSELNEKHDHRTFTGKHTLDYYKSLVASHNTRRYYDSFYVDDSGTLRFLERKRDFPKSPMNTKRLTKLYDKWYAYHNNQWYEVTICDQIPSEEVKTYIGWTHYCKFEDVFMGKCCFPKWNCNHELQKLYGKNVYCTSKKAVGKTVCKKLNAIWSKPHVNYIKVVDTISAIDRV